MSTATTPPDRPAPPPVAQGEVGSYRPFVFGIGGTLVMLIGILAFLSIQQTFIAASVKRSHFDALLEAGVVIAPATESALPMLDPFAAAWDDVPTRTIELKPQNLTSPSIEQVAVGEVTLQVVHDADHLAMRLTWPDTHPDCNVDTARFTDAAAVQFPLSPDASFMMGNKEMPVQILHWKALWQKDIDEHFQDVQDVHPNYWADLYWFAQPQEAGADLPPDYRVPDSFADPRSHAWFTARQAGNPVARFRRSQPVEELSAEGFGSLVTQAASDSAGRGVWRDGRWHLVIVRPMLTDDPADAQFHPTTRTKIGVAIWDGGSGNVGGRKQYSEWLDLQVLR